MLLSLLATCCLICLLQLFFRFLFTSSKVSLVNMCNKPTAVGSSVSSCNKLQCRRTVTSKKYSQLLLTFNEHCVVITACSFTFSVLLQQWWKIKQILTRTFVIDVPKVTKNKIICCVREFNFHILNIKFQAIVLNSIFAKHLGRACRVRCICQFGVFRIYFDYGLLPHTKEGEPTKTRF